MGYVMTFIINYVLKMCFVFLFLLPLVKIYV